MARLKLVLWAVAAFFLWRLHQADFWRAERFKDDVRVALEQALGRKVRIQGDASYSWSVVPGIAVEDVTIFEDPQHGVEPLLYANAIQARVRLGSLFTGRLALDKIILDEPSVNLHRNGQGVNVTPLLERVLARRSSLEGPLPDVRIRNGRFNFVFDQRKSILYLSACDLELTPIDDQTFRLQFEGEPARTDRKAVGFGRFLTNGTVRLGRGAQETSVDLSVDLDNTTLAEVAMLFEPRALDLGGKIASRTVLKGPLSNVSVKGNVTVSSGRRDLNPLKSSRLPLAYSGVINLRDQIVSLDAGQTENPGLAATVRLRARNVLVRPVWSALATFRDLPAPPVFALARDLALVDMDPSAFTGKLTGAFGFAHDEPQGGATLSSAAANEKWDATLRVAAAERHLDIGLEQASVTALKPFFAKSFPDGGPPILNHLGSGRLSGSMRFSSQATEKPIWSGDLQLAGAAIVIPGIAEPLESSANIQFEGERLNASAIAGKFPKAGLTLEGSYRYEPNSDHPHGFALSVPDADLSTLETLLEPALSRKDPGLLARTLLRADRPVQRLDDLHAEGTVKLGTLNIAGLALTPARLHLVWEGPAVDADFEAGSWKGTAAIDLHAAQPVYKCSARFDNGAWQGGRADASVTISTRGLGKSALANLVLEGSFAGRNLTLPPHGPVRQASGSFSGKANQLAFKSLTATTPAESYTGEGTSDANGKLAVTLSNAKRQWQFVGKIWPLALEPKP